MLAVAAAVALVGGLIAVWSGGDSKQAAPSTTTAAPGEVLLEPLDSDGPFPWTGSLVPPGAPTSVPLPTTSSTASPTSTSGGPVALTAVRGDRVGIYGGTTELSVCDREQLAGFLETHPGPARAFAQVLGIGTSQIRSYVTSLTPVILAADTRVTNHGYSKGRPTPRQSVLQAGTAVLIDDLGVPRVRCACGNPLLPPVLTSAPTYTGPRWPGFSPTTVVVVRPATSPMTTVTVIDTKTGTTVVVDVGSGGPTTTTAPASTTTSTGPATSTTLPRVTAPTTPTAPPTGPTTTAGVRTYRLSSITVTRTYGGNIGGDTTGTNAISPGTTTVAAGTRTFQLGWDYLWGDTKQNRNRAVGDVTLTAPDTVQTGVAAPFAAQMSGDWVQTGYGVDRDRTLTLSGAVGSASRNFGGAPSATVQGSISTALSQPPTIDAAGGNAIAKVDATIDFGGDHTGSMHVELVYRPTG